MNYVNEYIQEQVLGTYIGLNVRIEAEEMNWTDMESRSFSHQMLQVCYLLLLPTDWNKTQVYFVCKK